MDNSSNSDDFDEWSDSGDEFSQLDNSLVSPQKSDISEDCRAEVFRPTRRAPLGVLLIFDDRPLAGQRTSGEVVRLRRDQTTIGSSKAADICIPHDGEIAPRHIEILRTWSPGNPGRARWELRDLESPTGLMVRVRRAKLRDGSEFLVGSHRYRFVCAEYSELGVGRSALNERLERGSLPGASLAAGEIRYDTLRQVASDTTPQLGNVAAHVTGVATEESKRFDLFVGDPLWLIAGEYWIGRSQQCALSQPDDPFLAGKHLQIERVGANWIAQTWPGVTNGFWIRVSKLTVNTTCTFQLGEQRFRLIT